MKVSDDGGYGMLFASETSMNASALHFTPEDLSGVSHVKDLKVSKDTYVTLDCAVAGTGNNSCGYKTLEKYQIREPKYSLHFSMRPVDKDSDAMALSKKYQENVTVQAAPYTAIPIEDEPEPVKPAENVVKVNKVSGVKVTSGKKALTVSWKKQTGCKYTVAYSTSKKKLSKLKSPKNKVSGVKKVTVASNKTVLKKLKKGKVYYVKVAAVKTGGGKTVYGTFSSVKKKKTK